MRLTATAAGVPLSLNPVSDQRAALEAPEQHAIHRSLLSWRRDLTVNYQLYLLVLLPVVYIFVFMYIPMYGTPDRVPRVPRRQGNLGQRLGRP